MDRTTHLVIGVVLLGVAAVLLLGFRDTEILWFRGQPLGVVLGILGVLDLLDYARKRGTGKTSQSSS